MQQQFKYIEITFSFLKLLLLLTYELFLTIHLIKPCAPYRSWQSARTSTTVAALSTVCQSTH
jgi:hypothetical protein